MELVMAIVVGVLFAGGTYLILRPSLIRIVMGLALYSNAANLLMITCGGYSALKAAPFVGENAEEAELAAMMDPLPPDIILTAIVISFAVGALFLTTCYRVYLDHGTDNPEELPNHDSDEQPVQASIAGTPGESQMPVVPNVLEELARPNPNAPREPGGDRMQMSIKPQPH